LSLAGEALAIICPCRLSTFFLPAAFHLLEFVGE
jgi:hypothetical protein